MALSTTLLQRACRVTWPNAEPQHANIDSRQGHRCPMPSHTDRVSALELSECSDHASVAYASELLSEEDLNRMPFLTALLALSILSQPQPTGAACWVEIGIRMEYGSSDQVRDLQ